MVDKDVLSSRLAALDGYLVELRPFLDVSREQFTEESAVHHLAERFAHLACEAILDIAHHVISDLGFRQPETYRETMLVLGQEGLLHKDTAAKLADWMSLRNVLVHLYLEIDHGRVWDDLRAGFGDLETFRHKMAELL